MIIQHPKIRLMKPVWETFNGYSLIFEKLDQSAPDRGYTFSNSSKTVAAFDAVSVALRRVGRRKLIRHTLLCLLPKSSYHVTVADLINQGNTHRVAAPYSKKVKRAIRSVDPKKPAADPIFSELGVLPGTNAHFNIQFTFDGLTTMGGRALGLKLRPLNEPDLKALNALKDWRDGLLKGIFGSLGLPINAFQPHLTLGYFPNVNLVVGNEALLAELEGELAKQLDGAYFHFDGIALYGFTGMQSFFPVRQ